MRVAQAGLIALMGFLIRYRRTVLGPLWLLVGPALFVGLLGLLYAEISATPPSVFIPHLAIGFVTWTLIQGFVVGAPTVFQRARAQLLQGAQGLSDIVMVDVFTNLLIFLHQIPIVIAVFIVYGVPVTWTTLESAFGLALIIANGYWVTLVFGILGARYRDFVEILQAVMRITFLATPIIWMPGEGVQSGIMGAFLVFNPFYHFLELVRAPLLGQSPDPVSWWTVVVITIVGWTLVRLAHVRYGRFVPLWV